LATVLLLLLSALFICVGKGRLGFSSKFFLTGAFEELAAIDLEPDERNESCRYLGCSLFSAHLVFVGLIFVVLPGLLLH
jgi:hypothetical protein